MSSRCITGQVTKNTQLTISDLTGDRPRQQIIEIITVNESQLSIYKVSYDLRVGVGRELFYTSKKISTVVCVIFRVIRGHEI